MRCAIGGEPVKDKTTVSEKEVRKFCGLRIEEGMPYFTGVQLRESRGFGGFVDGKAGAGNKCLQRGKPENQNESVSKNSLMELLVSERIIRYGLKCYGNLELPGGEEHCGEKLFVDGLLETLGIELYKRQYKIGQSFRGILRKGDGGDNGGDGDEPPVFKFVRD